MFVCVCVCALVSVCVFLHVVSDGSLMALREIKFTACSVNLEESHLLEWKTALLLSGRKEEPLVLKRILVF